MEGISNIIEACYTVITIKGMILMFASTALGIIIGALPGLSATMGIALLTGLTFTLPKMDAITVLMGIYIGAIYGGSITAILINVPGTGSAAATALDGFPLAMKGEGETAIKVTRAASMVGTFIGMICLVTITPLITRLALQFTSAEYFLLSVFGILICGSVSARDLNIKGWLAGIIGILISLIGIDSIQSVQRFTFGQHELLGGIDLIPAMIGFFAIPQIIKTLRSGEGENRLDNLQNTAVAKTANTIGILKKHIGLIVRSCLIGVGIGALPGVGENVAAWLAYDNAKKTSKQPEKFGTGVYEAVIAPEVANNAAIGGAIIPMLSLAIPGSPPTAVLLGALLLHGIRPGPLLAQSSPMFIYELSVLLLIGTFMMWIVGIIIAKPLVKIIAIPNGILMPIVGVLCVIGAYSLNLSRFDLLVLFIFGIIGYALEEMGYPSAAIILGVILGKLLDENLRRTLMLNKGSIMTLFTRPIALLFTIAILYTVLGPFISKKIKSRFKDITNSAD